MKKCFCCELCAKALINALSHLLCFVLGKILICLLLCFYNSLLSFVHCFQAGMVLSGKMGSEQNLLFCIWLFSTGIRWSWTMNERSEVCLRKAPSWPFHLRPLQLCHLHICVQLPSTIRRMMLSFITYQHDSRQTRVPLLLKRPTELFTSSSENSLSQILISKEKARCGLWGEEGWSCNCGAEGKKLTSPGPSHYLGRITSPLCTLVSVKQGNTP